MVFFLIPAFIGSTVTTIVGFGSTGIGAGTLAAAWQSSIGSVVAGSVFATVQSAAATGVAPVVGGAAGALYGLCTEYCK